MSGECLAVRPENSAHANRTDNEAQPQEEIKPENPHIALKVSRVATACDAPR